MQSDSKTASKYVTFSTVVDKAFDFIVSFLAYFLVCCSDIFISKFLLCSYECFFPLNTRIFLDNTLKGITGLLYSYYFPISLHRDFEQFISRSPM